MGVPNQMISHTDTSYQDDLQVVNLSFKSLNRDETILLQKSFSFTPTPTLDTFTWVKDVNLFARKLALKRHHTIQNSDARQLMIREHLTIETLESLATESESRILTTSGPFSSLKPQSTFTPNFSQFINIEKFVTLVTNDLKNLNPSLIENIRI